MSKTTPSQSGFSLIEVMMGFVVLTLAITTLMAGLAGALLCGSRAHQKAEAIRMAENRLADLDRLGPEDTPRLETHGAMTTHLTLTAVDAPPRGGYQLMDVRVTVAKDQQTVLQLSTQRLITEEER
jgi:Tfp pilus assembly protein PilV